MAFNESSIAGLHITLNLKNHVMQGILTMHGSVLEYHHKMHLDFTEKPNYLCKKKFFRYFSRTLKYIVHSETNRLKGKHFRRVVHSGQKSEKKCKLGRLQSLYLKD